MSTIGIFFGTDTGQTRRVAKLIAKKLGDIAATPVNINRTSVEDFLAHDLLIIGTPTLGDGEVPGLESGAENESWAEFLPMLDGADMSGKIVAIFGLGDQASYSTEFCDAMVELYDCVSACGATVVGAWPTEGYDFETSQAVLDDKFVGLALDQDNQSDLTEARLDTWLEQIRPAMVEIYT